MIRSLTAWLVLAVATSALAVEPRVSVSAPAVAKTATLIKLDGSKSEGDDFLWESTTGESFEVDSNGRLAYFVASRPGKYRFIFVAGGTVEGKTRLVKAVTEIIVDGSSPTPPDVKPDNPPPPPPPIPSTVGNLRVLVLWETSAPNLRQHLNVLQSTAFRNYLSGVVKKDDGQPAWRFFDKDVTFSSDNPAWAAAFASAKAKGDTLAVPKIMIFAGEEWVTSIPLPTSEADAIAAVKPFAEKP